jgi:transcriptional regulator with XRE-family HTH domain
MSKRSREHVAIGAAIQRHRMDRGSGIGELAEAVGVDRGYLRGVEQGTRNPSLELLLAIAQAIDVPLSKLIAEAETTLERHT